MTPSSHPLVIFPTFDEARSIVDAITAVLAQSPALHVLVVDDASPDGTATLVRSHADFERRLFLLSRPRKLGLGSAYRDGFAWALARDYTAICEMDADLSHDPADLPRLLAALDAGAEAAIGSRYGGGRRVVDWPLHRLLLSLAAGAYVRLLTRLPLADPTSGYKALRRAALEAIPWQDITANGYGFQIALHFALRQHQRRLVEVPIVFTERRSGQSKLSFAVSLEAALLVPRLAWRRLTSRPA